MWDTKEDVDRWLRGKAEGMAEDYLGKSSFDDVTLQDIKDAEVLIGTYPRTNLPWGVGRWKRHPHESDDMKKEVGLLGLGDSAQGSLVNKLPVHDALIGVSGLLRDGLMKLSPGLVDSIDSADQKLFDMTNGLLGTPKDITPEQQNALRALYRMEAAGPDYRGEKYGRAVPGRKPKEES